jgi:hypothetical protein
MKVGFSGTQEGMTPEQEARVASVLWNILFDTPKPRNAQFHHGNCVGADEEAAAIANVAVAKSRM